jgi:NAD(P)-dependent dehydrogenase (short-subunit alcohol dehydrogenase family)
MKNAPAARRALRKTMTDKRKLPEFFPLKDKIAAVTGAARGIGEAVAHALARRGATVVLAARERSRLATVVAAIESEKGRAAALPCDLTDPQAVDAWGQEIARRFGRCDILVNNAGVGVTGKPLIEHTLEEWNLVMETNLRGPFLTIRALAPLMIAAGAGDIVNISSLAGRNPLPGGAAYSASKWGLNGLTYSVAEELRQYGIRVTAIAPGSVNTGFGASGSQRQEREGKDRAKMIQPADVAEAVLHAVMQPANAFVSEILLRPTRKP